MKKILIVEDEKNMRFLLKEELKEEGYEVTVASNAQEAEKILDGGVRFDLVTIDIEMEGMNGLELAGLMRKRLPDLKIVLLTAYTHYKHDLSSWAADAYIVKSPDFSELKALIRELI
ncbi:MAG TPA: response regulator [Mesotoga sp.]|nr:response regulator [Mesotoga sp.]MDI9376040.1 response regulator [Thermotogota bacterium]NLX33898.1 response regulator [Thermotogaceae bacterium]MDD4040335.1 response regulator [Mesotoga sp.]MDD4477735.1 response regulator [Mesotoga sp.]